MGLNLSGDVPASTLRNPDKILWNFVRMTIFFSLNHGSVTAVLGLAVPLLGNEAGSYSSGTLYITYALTALLLSAPIMSRLGTRKALIIGAFVYCVYVASFPVALIVDDPTFHILVAVIGGLIGGFAAGFLWNAQGAYFAKSTKRYAMGKGISQEAATGKFASIFAGTFLTLEVALKLLASAIKLLNPPAEVHPHPAGNGTNGTNGTNLTHLMAAAPPAISGGKSDAANKVGDIVVAATYSTIALLSSVFMLTIYEIERPGKTTKGEGLLEVGGQGEVDDQGQPLDDDGMTTGPMVGASTSLCTKVLGAMDMWVRHPRILLLNTIQMSFGVCASLLGVYISGEVASKTFGDNKVTVVGFMSAMVAALAALLQVPAGAGAKRLGKPPFMLASLTAFIVLGALCATQDIATLGTWPVLVACYCMQGIGRAGYEGTNKAIYADFFPDDSVAAFANVVLANGFASALTYFLFGSTYTNAAGKKVHLLTGPQMAYIALAVSGCAVVCYIAAEILQRKIVRDS